MKRIKIILMACTALILLAGCNTYQKQLTKFQGFAMQHTGELAKLCTAVFPVKDSVGKPEVTATKPANNANLKPALDSLKQQSDSLSHALAVAVADKTNPCAEVVSSFQQKVQQQQATINRLAGNYKKCEPDTVYVNTPVYRTDNAALQVLQNNNSVLHDSLTIVNTQLKASKDNASSRLKTIWILAGVIGLGVIFSILKTTGKV